MFGKGTIKQEDIPLVEHNWVGLARYRLNAHEETDPSVVKGTNEYAIVSTIITAKQLSLNYYADVAGPTPDSPLVDVPVGDVLLQEADEAGDASPQWGLDLVFDECNINYGPWANRQR